jgi:hypothetical protein
MNNIIKFSMLFDKLKDIEFTTIRSYTPEKEDYYTFMIGTNFQVWLSEPDEPYNAVKFLFNANLVSINVISPKTVFSLAKKKGHYKFKPALRDIIEDDVKVDGNIQQDWFYKISKMDRALLLIFSKSDPFLYHWDYNSKKYKLGFFGSSPYIFHEDVKRYQPVFQLEVEK